MTGRIWLKQLPPWLWLMLLGLVWRLVLTHFYYGWEESDYGNLAMAQGVLESRFTEYDLRHLPFYYFLSAVVLAGVGDAVLATHLVSTSCGVLCLGLAWTIAEKAFGRREAWLVGLMLCFQPEFALYGSSSLREPVFTALVLAGCALLLHAKPLSAAFVTGLSFLTRFDALAIGIPVILLQLLRRGGSLRRVQHPFWGAVAITGLVVGAWTTYCGLHHGQWLFFMPTVEVNLETGGQRDIMTLLPRLWAGLDTGWALFWRTLPNHLGWLVWGAAFFGLWVHRQSLFSRTPRGTCSLYLFLNTGFWLGIGVVAQHEPEHNLYWKWLFPLAPWWILYAAGGMVALWDRLEARQRLRAVISLGVALATALQWQAETMRQLTLSEQLYKPQLELAQWVEAHVPPGTTLLFDNIPACYINRRPHTYRFRTWLDLDLPSGDLDAFESFLLREQVAYVLWFREDWTLAPAIAPWLADPREHALGLLKLEPLRWDDAYGFVFYRVSHRKSSP